METDDINQAIDVSEQIILEKISREELDELIQTEDFRDSLKQSWDVALRELLLSAQLISDI